MPMQWLGGRNAEAGPRLACDRCHAKKLKCSRHGDEQSCGNCIKSRSLCVYSPPLKGGRPRKRSRIGSIGETITHAIPNTPHSEPACPAEFQIPLRNAGHPLHFEDCASGSVFLEDQQSLGAMNWNNNNCNNTSSDSNTQFSDVFRPWMIFNSPWNDPSAQLPSEAEAYFTPPQEQQNIFNLACQATSSKKNNSASTSTSNSNSSASDMNSGSDNNNNVADVTTNVDQLLDRLATLQRELMAARTAMSSAVLSVANAISTTAEWRDASLGSRLDATEHALNLAHKILEIIISERCILRNSAHTSSSTGCLEARNMLAAVMPAMLALDLYRDTTQLITSHLHQSSASSSNLWMTPVIAGGTTYDSGNSRNSQSESLLRSSDASLADVQGPVNEDLQIFLTLATMQYYLTRLEQATAMAGSDATTQDASETDGGSVFCDIVGETIDIHSLQPATFGIANHAEAASVPRGFCRVTMMR